MKSAFVLGMLESMVFKYSNSNRHISFEKGIS